ncbi:hypothetical protein [Clostridium beijerinckii]|uniref:ParB-like chromosome segregation protein Spo0J n=1 Tax=Clostridium beijerinckii TaxID=1520 RepID=A0AAE5H7H2_CLOBE|nr:hypothetical protein [Clostridium beijerinckii]NSB15869.1 ParB-like chromosome segregation protein Spo0J [Clostridium beijerinckii]OOM27992.1 hypothetical protein CLOBE_29100 [Clostridium beijerinckii]
MNDLIIDNEFKDLLPPLSEEQKEELERDIIKNGCINSLTVWKNILIDGHHRHEICTRNNIPFDIVEIEFKDRLEAMEWIWMNQKNRRNLTKYELAQIALKFKPVIEAKAKENLSKVGGDKKSENAKSGLMKSSKAIEPISTRKEVAKIAGVSEDTIHKVEVIEEKAPEEIKQQVKKGDITINSAYVLTKSAIEADKKNAEYEKEYQEQLEKEQQEQEAQRKLGEIEKNLPENAVVLDKFRKPKETHIFGIEDFNNLTKDQFNDCIKHSKKYRDAISKVALLSTDIEALMAWGAIANTPDIVEIELQDINSAIQNLIKIQNYFKGGK